MITDAKKASNAAWDRENMVYQTVKVRKEILEAFRAAVAANGDKVNTVLREAMEDYTARGNVRHGSDVATGEPDKEALPDLLTPYARQIALDASQAAGVPVEIWIERTLDNRAAAEADGRRFMAEVAARKEKEKGG